MTAIADERPETEGTSYNDRGELVLDLNSLRPKPRWIRVGDVEFKIPGNLPLDTMIELQQMESAFSKRDSTNAEAVDTLNQFTVLLTELIEQANPDVERIELDLDVVTAVRLLVFIAQPEDSMAAAFVKAITAGGGEKPDVASSEAHRLARAAGLEAEETEGETDGPLRSAKRSSSRSSRSASSTTGRRSGGKPPAARGKRSAPTSRSRSKGSGNANAT